MLMLDIRSTKITTDHMRRLAGAARGARGWLVGARGGITQGPVGDLENRFVSSW
jgi:hypothetical protein